MNVILISDLNLIVFHVEISRVVETLKTQAEAKGQQVIEYVKKNNLEIRSQ